MDNQNDQNNLNQDNTTNPAVVSDPVIPINQDTPPPPPVLENPVSQTPVTEELPSFSQVDSTSSDSFPIPTVEEVPEDTGSAAPDLDIPTTISTDNKPKKQFGGKAIATILGVLVLIGGIGAGVVLVRQSQDIREKAADCVIGECCQNGYRCQLQYGEATCTKPDAACTTGTKPLPVDNTSGAAQGNSCTYNEVDITQCTTAQNCPGTKTRVCNKYNDPATALGYYSWGNWSACVDKGGDDCPLDGVTGTVTSDVGVANECEANGGKCYSSDNLPICDTLTPLSQYNSSCSSGRVCLKCAGNTTPTSPDTTTSKTTSSSPTPISSPASSTVSCLNIKAYNSSWTQLSASDLSNLKSGDIVRFAVAGTATSGSFDKAKFTINSVSLPETTTKKTGTEEFYSEYTIPSGITSFTINAQIHHTTKGWI